MQHNHPQNIKPGETQESTNGITANEYPGMDNDDTQAGGIGGQSPQGKNKPKDDDNRELNASK